MHTVFFFLLKFCEAVPNFKRPCRPALEQKIFLKLQNYQIYNLQEGRQSSKFELLYRVYTFSVIGTCIYQVFWCFQVLKRLANSNFGGDKICRHLW